MLLCCAYLSRHPIFLRFFLYQQKGLQQSSTPPKMVEYLTRNKIQVMMESVLSIDSGVLWGRC